MDFTKVKLIIWDLDETFWQGTLSEGKVTLPEKNKNLIFQLTDIGIVNSICSKNYEDQVLVELDKYGLSDYFVFKSVNWEP
ncbi:MAG: FkbH domain-containing protein, partial [Bacteroidota bacterium]|nr:FkbH domain-containing protein [Bacteroidota bacterium]